MKSVCWFRNDLRVLDNPAFYYCCQNSEEVIAIFFVNRKQWLEHNDAEVKVNFWIRNLELLQQKLNELNIPLVILEADKYAGIKDVLLKFCQDQNIKNLYFNVEYPINELKRDREIFQSFKENGIGVFHYHDQVIHEPGTLKTKTGNNFSVYSPFKRKWFEELRDEQLQILDVPCKKKEMTCEQTDLSPFLDEFSHEYASQWPAGEEYIQNYISKFLRIKGAAYKQERNFPAIDATAKLSPYINAGIVSSKWCLVEALSLIHI